MREYPPGAAIVEEGALGSTLYVLVEGSARVVRGGKNLSELGPNDFFGEISLLDGGPRAASVVARTAVRCLEIWGKDFIGVLTQDAKLAVRILAGMARWLREAGGPGVPVDGAPLPKRRG